MRDFTWGSCDKKRYYIECYNSFRVWIMPL